MDHRWPRRTPAPPTAEPGAGGRPGHGVASRRVGQRARTRFGRARPPKRCRPGRHRPELGAPRRSVDGSPRHDVHRVDRVRPQQRRPVGGRGVTPELSRMVRGPALRICTYAWPRSDPRSDERDGHRVSARHRARSCRAVRRSLAAARCPRRSLLVRGLRCARARVRRVVGRVRRPVAPRPPPRVARRLHADPPCVARHRRQPRHRRSRRVEHRHVGRTRRRGAHRTRQRPRKGRNTSRAFPDPERHR